MTLAPLEAPVDDGIAHADNLPYIVDEIDTLVGGRGGVTSAVVEDRRDREARLREVRTEFGPDEGTDRRLPEGRGSEADTGGGY
jgi:hypothetical protein